MVYADIVEIKSRGVQDAIDGFRQQRSLALGQSLLVFVK